jgi:cell division transport system permease protein
MLGIIGALLLNSRKLSSYVRENIGFSVFLNNDVKEVDVLNFQKLLDSKNYVKETFYITKEQAAENFTKEIGEDFVDFLGYNPLPASIDLKLDAKYANNDSIAVIEKEILSYPEVSDVAYQKDLIYAINRNIQKISLGILFFSIFLFLISVTLINNTIRLSVYSKRFIIRTMQMVGAHSSYIRKPFLVKGVTQGLIAAFAAFLILFIILYIAENQAGGIFNFLDYGILLILLFSMLAAGVVIAFLSTLLSVNKYLHLKTDYLYT